MSTAAGGRRAVMELRDQIAQPDAGLVQVFCSANYDLDEVAAALREAFPDVLTVGCTTAGELGPAGYATNSLTGASLSRGVCHAEAVLIDRLSSFAFTNSMDAVRQLRQRMMRSVGPHFTANSFAMLLIDGMTGTEDSLLSAVHSVLPGIPLLGGSAADDLHFEKASVYKDGAFHADAAVLMLIHTPLPFRVFRTQHFVASDRKMVITGAIPFKRMVTEINAEPAALEYARLVGVAPEELSPSVFATHPLAVRVGGADYVRSIGKVNPDNSMTFFCAIDEGLVMSLAERVDPYRNMRQLFDSVTAEIGPPALTLGCDCVFHRLEFERCGLDKPIGELLAENQIIGFCTFGEQYNAMHVNQTFVGVAIGSPIARAGAGAAAAP